MGDFTGFTFGGYHSFDDLGVVRVSGGDRYEEELQPEVKDRTAEVPGLNGEYYFGSDYAPKNINIEIAFDSLTEEQFRKLKRVFGTKRMQELIFDERPYKKYMAKIESPVELSYVCFDEPKKIIGAERDGVRRITRIEEEVIIDEETGDPVIDEETGEPITESVVYRDLEQVTPYELQEGTMRIYKGEGKISFICYFPFAKSVYKVLPEESEEWAISSGLLTAAQREGIDIYTVLNPSTGNEEQTDSTVNGIRVYNAGDVDTGFRLYIPKAIIETNNITLTYKADQVTTTAALLLKQMTLKINDIGVLIDTNNQTIVGVSQFNLDISGNAIYTTTGNLYNEYVDSGYFFHLEPNTYGSTSTIEITNGSSDIKIFYDYLYF